MATITIPLTKGKSTIVDEADVDLAAFKWHADENYYTFYAQRSDHRGRPRQRPKMVSMHRVIMSRILGRNLLRSELVDHRDRNGLNNRRANLRICTNGQNVQNSRDPKKTKNYPRGVRFDGRAKLQKPFFAQIGVNGIKRHLGYFATPDEAHAAYRRASLKLHGEFSPYYEEATRA